MYSVDKRSTRVDNNWRGRREQQKRDQKRGEDGSWWDKVRKAEAGLAYAPCLGGKAKTSAGFQGCCCFAVHKALVRYARACPI